jgi:hypothetical protein
MTSLVRWWWQEMKADSDEYARANGTGYAEQFTGVQADDVGKLAAPAFKKVAMGAKLKANDVSNDKLKANDDDKL